MSRYKLDRYLFNHPQTFDETYRYKKQTRGTSEGKELTLPMDIRTSKEL